ncbi:MAG: A24 family peptidase [Anaerolineae bacterium]|nr:A24 family peptidase [Anaerolineae bacterium]
MPLILAVIGFLIGPVLVRVANFLINKKTTPLCPYCQTPYKPLLALKGLILQRGRCSSCRAPYLITYASAEIFTPAIFVLIWQKFGFSLYTFFALLYGASFIILFLTDVNYKVIPSLIVHLTIALAIIGETVRGSHLSNHLLGGAISFLLFLAFYALGQVYTRWRAVEEVAFGMGDVKLAFLIGIILGYPTGLRALLTGVLINGVIVLALIIKGLFSKRFNPLAPFPYGPGLILSFFIFWLFLS